MIKNLLVAALLLPVILLSTASGQTRPQSPAEIKGTELVKKASDKLKSFSSIRMEFSYEMEIQSLNMKEQMNGTLVSKGDKYHMTVGDNLFISDGTTSWAYMDDLDEVHISLVADSESAINPTRILEEFDTQFRATFIKQERHEGKTVDIIDLVPLSPQVFFKYRIALDAGNQMMEYAIAHDRDGGSFTYRINRFDTNVNVADNLFTFLPSQYPGVEIIDLR